MSREWIKPPEAAALLGCSETRLREMCRRREIPHLTGPLRFDRPTLEQWIAARLRASVDGGGELEHEQEGAEDGTQEGLALVRRLSLHGSGDGGGEALRAVAWD